MLTKFRSVITSAKDSLPTIKLHSDGLSLGLFSLRIKNIKINPVAKMSALILAVLPRVKAEAIADVYFKNPTLTTDYKAEVSGSYISILDSVKEGACGSVVDKVDPLINYEEIAHWVSNDNQFFARFYRGVSQQNDSLFENCIENTIKKQVDESGASHNDAAILAIAAGSFFGTMCCILTCYIACCMCSVKRSHRYYDEEEGIDGAMQVLENKEIEALKELTTYSVLFSQGAVSPISESLISSLPLELIFLILEKTSPEIHSQGKINEKIKSVYNSVEGVYQQRKEVEVSSETTHLLLDEKRQYGI